MIDYRKEAIKKVCPECEYFSECSQGVIDEVCHEDLIDWMNAQLQAKDKVIEAVKEYKKAREEYQGWQPIKKVIEPLQNVLNIYDKYKEEIK